MEEKLHLVFNFLRGRTRTNVGNHKTANFCSTKEGLNSWNCLNVEQAALGEPPTVLKPGMTV